LEALVVAVLVLLPLLPPPPLLLLLPAWQVAAPLAPLQLAQLELLV